jgi:hypothetical protein
MLSCSHNTTEMSGGGQMIDRRRAIVIKRAEAESPAPGAGGALVAVIALAPVAQRDVPEPSTDAADVYAPYTGWSVCAEVGGRGGKEAQAVAASLCCERRGREARWVWIRIRNRNRAVWLWLIRAPGPTGPYSVCSGADTVGGVCVCGGDG